MADTKISALTELAAEPATGDLIPLVDISDTTMAASGSTKRITSANLMKDLTDRVTAVQHLNETVIDSYREQTDPTSGRVYTFQALAKTKQSGTVSDGIVAVRGDAQDRTDVTEKAITGAANNGSGLIRITATSHGYSTGDRVIVDAVGGTTEANGLWTITNISANTFDLQGSTFTNAYTSGGIVTNRGLAYAGLFAVVPRVARGGITSVLNGDDVDGVVIQNNGTANGTDGLYFGHKAGITDWKQAITIDAHATTGMAFAGSYTDGLVLHTATLTTNAITLPNNKPIVGRNAAGSAHIEGVRINASDQLSLRNAVYVDASSNLLVNNTSPNLINGGKGIQIRSTDGTFVEITATADTAASASASLEAKGRSGSNDVRGRLMAQSGGTVRLGSATNHSLEIQSNSATRITIAGGGGISFANVALGFFGATAVSKSANTVTVTNYTQGSRSFDRSAYTMDQLADMVCEVVRQLGDVAGVGLVNDA